jgi:hypothetical protein
MYVSSINDVKTIFKKAQDNGAELVVQLGDMCNDYFRSSELIRAYLYNEEKLDVCGIYGNHELETPGNDMAFVTPIITNLGERAVWGTEDGKIGGGSIAYYYFDKEDFRFICTDTNYSINPQTGKYEHNKPASWGPPEGNTNTNALGTEQLAWLRELLLSSAKEGKHCIVLSHTNFCDVWGGASADSKAVQALFKEANLIRNNTVILALNGHHHNNRHTIIDGVVYLDINTVRCGWWQAEKLYAYTEEDIDTPKYTFEYTEYDQGGTPAHSFKRPLSSLTMGAQTLFYSDPLSAIVTVSEDGSLEMKGMKTEWMYGIAPKIENADALLGISDFKK